MIGDNVTSDFLDNLANHQYQKMHNEPMITGDWRKAANEGIVDNLVKKIEELLDGEAKHYIVADKKTSHRKIVIEYDYSSNLQ